MAPIQIIGSIFPSTQESFWLQKAAGDRDLRLSSTTLMVVVVTAIPAVGTCQVG